MSLDKNTVKLEVVEATEDVVEGLLAVNKNNRKVTRDNISKILRDINSGNWKYNLEVIEVVTDRFGKWKKLISGQHRLLALREAGYPEGITLNVISGYDSDPSTSDMYIGTDVGKPRKGSDVLELYGVTNSNSVVAAINVYARSMGPTRNMTPAELHKFYEDHKDEIERGYISKEFSSAGGMRTRPSSGFYSAVMADLIDGHEDVVDFYTKVLSPTGWTEQDCDGNPLWRLRGLIERSVDKGTQTQAAAEVYFIAARKCFDYARRKRKMGPLCPKTIGGGVLLHGKITASDARAYANRAGFDPDSVNALYDVAKADNRKGKKKQE